MPDVNKFLTEMKSSSNADLASKWAKVEEHYNKKLWHQLTVQLQSIIKEPSMQDNLIPMYKEFIVAFIPNVFEKVKMNNEACHDEGTYGQESYTTTSSTRKQR